jgi:hypothetical protein
MSFRDESICKSRAVEMSAGMSQHVKYELQE